MHNLNLFIICTRGLFHSLQEVGAKKQSPLKNYLPYYQLDSWRTNFMSSFQERSIDYDYWSDEATYVWLYKLHPNLYTIILKLVVLSNDF